MTQVRGGTCQQAETVIFFLSDCCYNNNNHVFLAGGLAGWVKAVRKSGKKVRMGECEVPSVQCRFQVRLQVSLLSS